MNNVKAATHRVKRHFQNERLPCETTVLYFALTLTLSLTLLVPLLALGAKILGAPLIITLPVGLGITLLLYVVVAIRSKQLLSATAIATIIFATFSANLPLLSGATAYPGTLGPQLLPLHFVLVGLLALLVASNQFDWSFSRVELAFGGFVVWSGLSATIGGAGHPVTALYFTAAMFISFLGLASMRRVVSSRILSLKHVMLVLVVAVSGQCAFAFLQLINQGPFGLTFLGEIGRSHIWTHLWLPIIGKFGTGVFVSGFTGGNGPLAVLTALTIPLAATGALDRSLRSRWRFGAFGCTILLVFVLAATSKESAFGGVVVGALAAAAAFLYQQRNQTESEKSINYGIFGVFVPLRISSHSESIRIKQYIAGIKIFRSHPLFGVGGANYPYHAPDYGLPKRLGEGGNAGLFPLHNQYIAALAETGLPGFAFFAGAIALVAWGAWRQLSSHSTILSYGLLAAVVSYAAAIFWVVNVRYTMVVPFWLLAGAIAAASSHAEQTSVQTT